MPNAAPKIAVAPTDHEWYEGVSGAVQRGGGQLASSEDAEALVWLARGGIPGLADWLHPGTRWVQLRGAGVEYWLNSGELDHERLFTSARGAYARPVGEHVAALVLAAAKRLHVCARATAWDAAVGEGRLLRGARVGIIGAGGIGQEAIRYLEPYGVRIAAVTRSGREVPGADESLSADSLPELWPQLDYAVLLAPATSETTALVGRAELAAMPDDAWVINVARGSLIDTDALVDALRNDEIGGAALDVTTPEPLPPEHPLWTLPNVLITPHVGNPKGMQLPMLEDHVEENVSRYVRGKELLATVDVEAGY